MPETPALPHAILPHVPVRTVRELPLPETRSSSVETPGISARRHHSTQAAKHRLPQRLQSVGTRCRASAAEASAPTLSVVFFLPSVTFPYLQLLLTRQSRTPCASRFSEVWQGTPMPSIVHWTREVSVLRATPPQFGFATPLRPKESASFSSIGTSKVSWHLSHNGESMSTINRRSRHARSTAQVVEKERWEAMR